MRNLVGLAAGLFIALAGCGQGASSSSAPAGAVPKNIETETKRKVDAAIEAGKAAADEAIDAASGAPPRDGGS